MTIRLGRLDDIPDGTARGFSFGGGTGRREIFVYRGGGTLLGYENACPHQGTPLNFLPDRFLNRERDRFLCATHGAQFRRDDGYCVSGPCEGKSLKPIALRVEGAEIFWVP